MTQDQAKALVINADENVLQGWLDLQQMWFNNRSDPEHAESRHYRLADALPAKPGRENAANAAGERAEL